MVNPLQRLRSIKVKFSVVIVAAVAVTLAVNEIGLKLNFAPLFRAGVAAVIALGMVQLMSRGMTSPLREMEKAATAMAAGDVSSRIETSSADEVGRLAVAFNLMAEELAEVDRQRRELVANVSHELRTPISALRATLENLVDGVVAPDPALLRTMLGELQPDAGTVRFGTNVDLAYYDQQLDSVNPDDDLVEAIRPVNNPTMTPGQLRDVLARFGLKGEIVNQRVGSLSGGERSKTALAKVAALNANLLILDEPTNDLDAETLELLENVLMEYSGTVLLVSHDRTFLNHVISSALVYQQDGLFKEFGGGYDDWQDRVALSDSRGSKTVPGRRADGLDSPVGNESAALANGLNVEGSQPRPAGNRPARKSLNFKEQRELESMPQLMEHIALPRLTVVIERDGGAAVHRTVTHDGDE